VPEFTHEELVAIVERRQDRLPPTLSLLYSPCPLGLDLAAKIAAVYTALNQGKVVKPGVTIREVIKWTRRFNLLRLHRSDPTPPEDRDLWVTAGWSLLSPRVSEASRADLESILCSTFGAQRNLLQVNSGEPITLTATHVTFRLGIATLSFPVGDGPGEVRLERSPLFEVDHCQLRSRPPLSFQRTLVQVVFATHACEPVLLLGPTCYKSLLVETWCRIFGRTDSLLRVHLTPETESPDLIGQMHPYSLRTALLEIVGVGRRLLHRVAAVRSTYRYHASRAALDLETLLKDALDGAQVAIERGLGVVEEGLGANDEARDEAGSAVTAANTCVVAIDGVPFIRFRL
jgi:hypothetical protein